MVNRQLSFQRLILSLSFLFIIAFTTTYSQQTRTDEDLRMRARIVPSTEGSSSIIPYTPIPQSTESRRIR
ncbi:MAG: hypothetical protein KGZ58_09820, partial [Ignavibacteriales bacterium]|nr:hypothetical protein [Ignavibacteriales bacterium]